MNLSDTVRRLTKKPGFNHEPELFEGPAVVEQPEENVMELFFPREKGNKFIELTVNSREKEYCIQFVQTSDHTPASITRSRNIDELIKDYSQGNKIYVEGKLFLNKASLLFRKRVPKISQYTGTIRVNGRDAYKFFVDYEKPIAESVLIKLKD